MTSVSYCERNMVAVGAAAAGGALSLRGWRAAWRGARGLRWVFAPERGESWRAAEIRRVLAGWSKEELRVAH